MCKCDNRASSPPLAVQASVLDGLGQVLGVNDHLLAEVGDRAGDLQDLRLGARGQQDLPHRGLAQTPRLRRHVAVRLELLRGELSVGVLLTSLVTPLLGPEHPRTDLR